jgi:hypothetical protein
MSKMKSLQGGVQRKGLLLKVQRGVTIKAKMFCWRIPSIDNSQDYPLHEYSLAVENYGHRNSSKFTNRGMSLSKRSLEHMPGIGNAFAEKIQPGACSEKILHFRYVWLAGVLKWPQIGGIRLV